MSVDLLNGASAPFAGKRVLITGASRGIGRATALAFARQGARVLANARDAAALEALAHDVSSVVPLPGDVCGDEDRLRLVEAAGPIDVLVNNAGVTFYGPVEETPEEELRRVMETNFFAAARLARLVLPGMRMRGGGTIVQVSSPCGRRGFPGIAAYSASKGALNAWTEALRLEVAPDRIRVLLVHPDVTASELYERASASPSGRAYQERLRTIPRNPAERVAAQIVDAVRFDFTETYCTLRSRLLPWVCALSADLTDALIRRWMR